MVIREENTPIIRAMSLIASRTVTNATCYTNTEDNEPVMKSILINKINLRLGEAILNTYYTEYLAVLKQNNPNAKLQGLIKPKPTSILEAVNYDKIDDNVVKFNLPIINDELETRLAKRLADTILTFKAFNNYVNDLIVYTRNLLPNINKTKPAEDYFVVIPFTLFDTYNYLKDTGHLTPFPSTNDVFSKQEDIAEHIARIKANITGVLDITTDLELDQYIKDDLKNILDKDEFLTSTNQIFDKILDYVFNGKFLTPQYADSLNYLVVLAAYVLDYINKAKKEFDYTTINTLEKVYNAIVENINKIKRLMDNDISAGVVVYRTGDTEDGYNIYVYEETFSKLQENNIPLKVLAGAVLAYYSLSEGSVRVYLKLLTENLEKYEAYFIKFKNDLVLANKTETYNKLVNLYIVALTSGQGLKMVGSFKELVDEPDYDKVKKYLMTLPLDKIQDVKYVIREVIELFYVKDISIVAFMESMKEAVNVVGNDITPEQAAGYAAFKYFLYYLAGQTYMI